MNEQKALVLTTHDSEDRWIEAEKNRLAICLRNYRVLEAAVAGDHDLGPVIFDRSLDSFEFLRFLASLPGDFRGDVLSIRTDGTGFLSAIGRGDGRLLYSLQPADVEFYLEFRFPSTAALALPSARPAAAYQMAS